MNLRTMVKDTGRHWIGEHAEQPTREARRRMSAARRMAMRSRHRAETTAQRGYFNARLAATRANLKARMAAAKAGARGSEAAGSKKAIGAAGIVGAAGAFFLDPENGHSRRESLRRFMQRDSGRPEDEIAMAPSASDAPGNGQRQPVA